MPLVIKRVIWPVDKEFDDAIRALGKAAVGDNLPPLEYNRDEVYERAGNVAEACQTRLVDKNFRDAVWLLAGSVLHDRKPREQPYSDEVYEAARNVAKAYETARSKASHICRLTHEGEYEAELERRRQIGLTIDPATAETRVWSADRHDPYHILGIEFDGSFGIKLAYFARNPGASDAEWVHCHDLPIVTRKALWQQDKRLADLDEHKAQIDRRRRIGLSIDPDTAEIARWDVKEDNLYGVLDEEDNDCGWTISTPFARNPGGTWVYFDHLPEWTQESLLERFREPFVFPCLTAPGIAEK